MKYIFEKIKEIEELFEKSIYLYNDICYLQYFEDRNKITARVTQFLCLINNNFMSLIMIDGNKIAYKSSMINYYESEDDIVFFIKIYKDKFKYSKEIKANENSMKMALNG